jgi:hypothetical protein
MGSTSVCYVHTVAGCDCDSVGCVEVSVAGARRTPRENQRWGLLIRQSGERDRGAEDPDYYQDTED